MSKSADPKNRGYTNGDIVIIAVYQLGGALRHIHLEDVAMKAAELSPRRFCWKKYPEQINLEAVRITLKNELGPPKTRVVGSIRDGWMLTPEGLSWCLAAASGGDNQALLDELRREVARAKKTAAFSKMISGEVDKVSTLEVEALLRVNDYSTPRNRRERIIALANSAMLDAQLRSVLANLRERGFDELEVRK
jgi:hypothetical protein